METMVIRTVEIEKGQPFMLNMNGVISGPYVAVRDIGDFECEKKCEFFDLGICDLVKCNCVKNGSRDNFHIEKVTKDKEKTK